MIWPWLLFDYYHPKSPKSRFILCFQWFCNHSEKTNILAKNRITLENTAFYQDAPENSDCCYVFCSAIMKHSGGFKHFTKVTSPLGSIARACRFKSCRAHQLVASVISLATSFYVSHKSSSRAHSAAPRFKIATISLGCEFVFPMAKAILSFKIVTASHGFVRERSRRKRSPLGAKKRRRKRWSARTARSIKKFSRWLKW